MDTQSNYLKTAHKAGRIGTVVAVGFMLGIPFVLGFYYHALPPLDLVMQVGGGLLLMYIPLSISEVASYATILGSSSYITYITGNIIGIKLPVALNALKIAQQEQSTEGGDAIATFAVAASSMATMLIIGAGVLIMVPLRPILELPAILTASGYLMPALLGSLMLTATSPHQGKYFYKGRLFSLIPCVTLMTILVWTKLWNPALQGFFIVAMIPLTILTARFLYKKEFITVSYSAK